MNTDTDPKEALSSLREFLADLDPQQSELVITDITGRQHRINTLLPTRRHIRVLRHMDDLADLVSRIEGTESPGKVWGWMKKLRKAIHNDHVVDLIGLIFREAYPGVTAELVDGEDLMDCDPLDYFTLEVVLEALAPLLLGLVSKTVKIVDKMTSPKQTP